MYAMPCDSVTVRGTRAILCYRPADRGYNRYVTLDTNIKKFHKHFAVYTVDGEQRIYGVTVVDNQVRDCIAPEGDYFTIAKIWEAKYQNRVVFLRAFTMDISEEGNINDALTQHLACLNEAAYETSV